MDQDPLVQRREIGVAEDAPLHTVDAAATHAFALATNDDAALYEKLSLAPPAFAAVVSYPAVKSLLFRVVPEPVLPSSVHLSQFTRFHRQIHIGDVLAARATVFRIRTTAFGCAICFKVTIVDETGVLVNESYHDVLLRGARGEPGGSEIPQPRFSRRRGTTRLGETVIDIADDQSIRYGLASKDQHPIHHDVEFARNAGFPNLILHGMCTYAMCGQAVIRFAADGDPHRLVSLAATFTQAAIVGRALHLTVDGGADGNVGFAATQLGRPLIRHGVAELASRAPVSDRRS